MYGNEEVEREAGFEPATFCLGSVGDPAACDERGRRGRAQRLAGHHLDSRRRTSEPEEARPFRDGPLPSPRGRPDQLPKGSSRIPRLILSTEQ
jgi:hypothetical protein